MDLEPLADLNDSEDATSEYSVAGVSQENSRLDPVLSQYSQPSNFCLAPRRLSGLSSASLQERGATGSTMDVCSCTQRTGEIWGAPVSAESFRKLFFHPDWTGFSTVGFGQRHTDSPACRPVLDPAGTPRSQGIS